MIPRLDHGAVGNGRVLALIAPDTSIEWLCLPRPDAPSLFAALLDQDIGGRLRVDPALPPTSRQTQWVQDTHILQTTFVTPQGSFVVEDFCPSNGGDTPPAELVRLIRPLDGQPRLRIHLDARPDYARQPSLDQLHQDRVQLTEQIALYTVGAEPAAVLAGDPITLERPLALILSHGAPYTARSLQGATAARDQAIAWWRRWASALPPSLPALARRAALCIRLHVYQPTGAILAAATTSLPEALHEERNWDYRFTWVRDGSFAAEALLRVGDTEVARRFLDFMERTIGPHEPQPLYGIDGNGELTELILEHLRGFADTQPVRIGNAAAKQVQNDTYGQLVWLAARLAQTSGQLPTPQRFAWLAQMVERAALRRHDKDAGIWEFRDRPRRYTFSRLWCWVAFDRGAWLAQQLGEKERAERWTKLAQDERRVILEAADRQTYFAQTLDEDDADASSLLVAALGLVPATDPRFLRTLERCEESLVVDNLMRRYVALDDFGETTSTFSLCTMWWVEALARAGQKERAQEVLAHMTSFANPLGLFSEDVDPRQRALLGNFPQVYTHIGLLQALQALE